jgi:hypothetical protein
MRRCFTWQGLGLYNVPPGERPSEGRGSEDGGSKDPVPVVGCTRRGEIKQRSAMAQIRGRGEARKETGHRMRGVQKLVGSPSLCR